MSRTSWITGWLLLVVLKGARGQESPAERERIDFFERHIRPVLIDRCYKCHSVRSESIKGGLLLDSREGLLKGGDAGPAVVPGDPEKSPLIRAVRYIDQELQMPPKGRLTPEQVGHFETWVRMGVPDPRTAEAAPGKSGSIDLAKARTFWSFRPLARSALPAVRDEAWPLTDIDRFVLAKLEERGLRPAPDADRRTLIRRATFDLIGLPPTPDEVEAFLRDDSPNAFARVVDRLLASTHYGERWGRHWLDVVRYADTAGDNADYPIPQAHLYRDYVIDAFNRDKPYDAFVREQVAGDLLPFGNERERREHIIATGFVAIARRFGLEPDADIHLTIDDTIDTMGRAMLGLTLSCARCHDHKFDPIPTEDYYGLYGIFQSTRYPFAGGERMRYQKDFVPLLPPAEADALLKPFDEKMAALDAQVRSLKDALVTVEKDAGPDAKRRLDETRKALGDASKKRAELAKQRPVVDDAIALAEGVSGNARIQVKGNPKALGAEVPRRFLQILGGAALPLGHPGSGRLELAGWLTDPANPLTPRVMVNRIWQHHFGKGLVPTPSDFGKQGLPPSHPELLDDLARRFVDSGWSVKAMHRLLMRSRTYRQSSVGLGAIDSLHELLWKFPRRRLEAEEIRDSMLFLSGALDRSPAGAHPIPPRAKWDYNQALPFQAVYPSNRRTVYLLQQRSIKHPYLSMFDGPDLNGSAPVRPVTTTPIQALFAMNSPFVQEQAERLGSRIRREGGSDTIGFAHLLVFGRPPTPEERSKGAEFLKDAPDWTAYARVLLASNEFMVLD